MGYRPVHDPGGRPLFAVDQDDPRGRSRAPVNRCHECAALIAWIPKRNGRIFVAAMVSYTAKHGATYDSTFEHTREVCRARGHLLDEALAAVDGPFSRGAR